MSETELLGEQEGREMANGKATHRRGVWLTAPRASVFAASIGIGPAVVTALVALFTPWLNPTVVLERKLLDQVPSKVGWTVVAYPHLGLALSLPSNWIRNDAAALAAGGEAELVEHYDQDTKTDLGILLTLRSVVIPFIDDPAAQVSAHYAFISESDPNATVVDFSVAGLPAKLYRYQRAMGGATIGDIKEYVVRIIPQIELRIQALDYTDAPGRVNFWRQEEMIIQSLVIDRELYSKRSASLLARPKSE